MELLELSDPAWIITFVDGIELPDHHGVTGRDEDDDED